MIVFTTGTLLYMEGGHVLVNPLTDVSEYLYHYTSAETALTYILGKGTLRFNTFENLNDPREAKAWSPDLSYLDTMDPSLQTLKEQSITIGAELKLSARLLCFCRDYEQALGLSGPVFRGFAKPQMWHFYGDRHAGACLVFNRKKLLEAFQTQIVQVVHSEPVAYKWEQPLVNVFKDPFSIQILPDEQPVYDVRKHIAQYRDALFFTKQYSWEHEREFRFLTFVEEPGAKDYEFRDSLEGIVMGSDCKRHDEFVQYAQGKMLPSARMDWHNGIPRLEVTS